MAGRPTDYTEELASRVCSLMIEGQSIKKICEAADMPDPATIYRWLTKHDKFRDNYAKAQQDRTTVFAEQLLDIADQYDKAEEVLNPDLIQRAKLKIDTRKWLMSKMDPKRYGDKVAMTDGDGGPLQVIVKQFTLAND